MTGQRPRGRLLLVTALALFAITSSIAGASAANINGRVKVNGHKLHLECKGSGSPTVVFEAGSGEPSSDWDETIRSLSKAHVRLCAYDRYGIGASDVPESPITRTIEESVTDKHDLLAAAGVKGPYILVSHSLGGLIDRYYAKVYPGQVVGAVMIETAPDDWNIYTHDDSFEESPLVDLSIATASLALRSSDRLGKRPLVVIEAEWSNVAESPKYWNKRQRSLAKISSNSIFFVAKETDHMVPFESPKLVAKSIQLVVTSARRHKHLPSCKAAKLAGARC